MQAGQGWGWRWGRGGFHLLSPGVLNFQGPPSPEEGPAWADTGGAEQGRQG